MDELVVGKVYIGKTHNFPVRYVGLEYDQKTGWLYQFEEVFPKHPSVVGYGQNQSQMFRDEYKFDENMTILYGKI